MQNPEMPAAHWQAVHWKERYLSRYLIASICCCEMEDIVCRAAHDLRSPISNLKSLVYLMRHDFVDHGDGKLDLINMMDDLADQSLNVISETMVQVMTQNSQVVSGTIDLGAVCDDILVLLDPLRLHTVSYPRIELHVDGTAIQIILRNLVDNAFNHADGRAARVEISVSQIHWQKLHLQKHIVVDRQCRNIQLAPGDY